MSAFLRYNEHIKVRSFNHILMLSDVPKGSDMLFNVRKKTPMMQQKEKALRNMGYDG